METLILSIVLPVSREKLYHAWLDSDEHTKFTASSAVIDPRVGGEFYAWNGYITGKNLELEPSRRILQSWRTTDFADEAPDSLLEIMFESVPDGTRLILRHTNIPEGQAVSYEQGWQEYYFAPMLKYFAARLEPVK
jgi:activator of HSP90 ATPase